MHVWHKRCLPPVAVKMASLISAPIPTDYLNVMVEESNYAEAEGVELTRLTTVGASSKRDGYIVDCLINVPKLEEGNSKKTHDSYSGDPTCAYQVVIALNNDVKEYMAEGWVPVGPSSLTITPSIFLNDEGLSVHGEKIVAIQTMVKY